MQQLLADAIREHEAAVAAGPPPPPPRSGPPVSEAVRAAVLRGLQRVSAEEEERAQRERLAGLALDQEDKVWGWGLRGGVVVPHQAY